MSDMDCSEILEILDCVRPDSTDLDHPDLADARTHLDACDACQLEFTSRQQFDRAVSTVARDVEVPEGLQQSLLNGLSVRLVDGVGQQDPPAAATVRNVESVSAGPRGRLRRRLSLLTLSGLAAVALLISYWPKEVEQFPVQSLLVRATANPDDVQQLDRFNGGPVSNLPGSFHHPRLGTGSSVYGKDLDGDSAHDIAMTVFKFSHRGYGTVMGVVVAVPASRVADLPATGSFSQASHQYSRPGDFAAASVVWLEGDTVYLAFVPRRNAPALEAMQRELRGVAV